MKTNKSATADRKTAARARAATATRTDAELPRWLPVVVYAVVTLVLFRETAFGARLLGLDNLELGLFARDFYTNFIREFHRFPVWQPYLYGGMPFLEGMHGDIFYPLSLAMFFMDAQTMWGWKMLLHIFLAGCFTYLWLRAINVSRGAAFVGGLIYLMSPLLVSMVYPGGDGKLFNYALAPLLFLLTERMVALHRLRDYAAFALGVALLVFTSQMQVAYFCIWGVSLYFFFRIFQEWRNTRSSRNLVIGLAGFAAAGLIGVAAAAVQFMPPLDYLREWSHRAERTQTAESGYAFSTSWSLHPEEIVSLLVPEFVGDNVSTETRSGQTYWGRNAFKLNHEYASFIPLLLLPLLFLRRRDGRTIFFTVLAALALLYALGANTPFFKLFYLIPGVSLFRAPSLIIFLYGLSAVTLAALAIDRVTEWAHEQDAARSIRKTLWITVGVLSILALFASTGLLVEMWRNLFPFEGPPQLVARKVMSVDANIPLITAGFWIVFFLAALVVAAWEGYARGMYGARGLIVALAIIAFVDLYRVDRPFIGGTVLMNRLDDPIRTTPDESIRWLQERQQAGEIFRAFDLSTIAQLQGQGYGDNTLALHGIEQLAGHHGNEIGRYRQLIGADKPVNLLVSELRLADVTNTLYLLSPQPIQVPGLTEVYRGSRTIIYRKDAALPRAYLVSNVQTVPEAQTVQVLLSPDFNAQQTALISEPLPAGITLQPFTRDSVEWLERSNGVQRLRVSVDAPALLVVLDNYYQAWHAYVDGREVPLLRVNHTFRGIPVPAGEHEVAMRYSTEAVSMWASLSGIVLLVLLGLAFGPPLRERLRRT